MRRKAPVSPSSHIFRCARPACNAGIRPPERAALVGVDPDLRLIPGFVDLPIPFQQGFNEGLTPRDCDFIKAGQVVLVAVHEGIENDQTVVTEQPADPGCEGLSEAPGKDGSLDSSRREPNPRRVGCHTRLQLIEAIPDPVQLDRSRHPPEIFRRIREAYRQEIVS